MFREQMTFGRYKDEYVQDVPSSYLSWCLRECRNIDRYLRAAIHAELTRRCERDEPAPDEDNRLPAVVDGLVKKWFRHLVMKHHPDRGGNGEVMAALNTAYEELRDTLAASGSGRKSA